MKRANCFFSLVTRALRKYKSNQISVPSNTIRRCTWFCCCCCCFLRDIRNKLIESVFLGNNCFCWAHWDNGVWLCVAGVCDALAPVHKTLENSNYIEDESLVSYVAYKPQLACTLKRTLTRSLSHLTSATTKTEIQHPPNKTHTQQQLINEREKMHTAPN